MLVVGECGDGKSTLINALRDPNKSTEALCGRNPEGVTKAMVIYPCRDLDGVPFNLIDTPGVGDGLVTPVVLIALIEEFLKSDMVPGGIRGVIVTTPVPDNRIRLGAQIVQTIVDKGFVSGEGENKYANVILTGTKTDRAVEEDRANFMEGIDGGRSVRELFFKPAQPPGKGPAVMVSKDDYAPLVEAIKKLPVMSIRYKPPDAKVMASALAEKLGVEIENLEEELASMREMVQNQSAQIKGMIERMHEADMEHREEMRKSNEQMAELRRNMLEQMQREAEERRQLRQEQQQLRAEEREEAQREMEKREAIARQQQREQEQVLQQLRKNAEAQRKKHQQEMQRIQGDMQKRQSGGCFPGSATVETPQGPKPMTALRAGDEVLAVAASGELFFDEVHFFGHAAPEELGPYVWLRTSSGKALRASPRHFVPVLLGAGATAEGLAGRAGWRMASYRYAGEVRVGDELWVRGAGGNLAHEAVLEVTNSSDKGIFNPFTLSGTLLVDGVVASAHSDWLLDDIVPSSWVPSLPSVYQVLLLPGRVLYRLLGPAAADMLEVNNPQGERNPILGTSRSAFAFFVASYLLPAVAASTAVVQRFALS